MSTCFLRGLWSVGGLVPLRILAHATARELDPQHSCAFVAADLPYQLIDIAVRAARNAQDLALEFH
jgi:hypothetical protein